MVPTLKNSMLVVSVDVELCLFRVDLALPKRNHEVNTK